MIVEARIAYRGADGRVTEIYGHREAASYRLTPGADAAIRVPPGLFKEAGGALLVAVTLAGGGEEDRPPPVRVAVAAVPQPASACACCVYVEDRFSAIRLNRAQGSPEP